MLCCLLVFDSKVCLERGNKKNSVVTERDMPKRKLDETKEIEDQIPQKSIHVDETSSDSDSSDSTSLSSSDEEIAASATSASKVVTIGAVTELPKRKLDETKKIEDSIPQKSICVDDTDSDSGSSDSSSLSSSDEETTANTTSPVDLQLPFGPLSDSLQLPSGFDTSKC